MALSFFGEVFKDSEEQEKILARLGIQNDQEDNVYLTSGCESMEQFEEEVRGLQQEMEDVLGQVRAKWQALTETEVSMDNSDPFNDPKGIWQDMENCKSDQEMIDFFNGFDEEIRKKVAEYVLTSVNMFQGSAPIFASHYNNFTHRLE